MQVYWLTDRTTGEVTLVDGDTVERLLGIDFGYVEWCIEIDGMFENGKWRVDVPKLGKRTRAERRPSLQMRNDTRCF